MSTRCASIAKALGEYPGGSALVERERERLHMVKHILISLSTLDQAAAGGSRDGAPMRERAAREGSRFGSGSLGNPGDFLDSERASRLVRGSGRGLILLRVITR